MKKVLALFSLALLFVLAGCSSVEPEIPFETSMTLEELEKKMEQAMDPEGRFERAKTFLQRYMVQIPRFLDDPETYILEVRYEDPDRFNMLTREENQPKNSLIIRGNFGWKADYVRKKVVELKPEELHRTKVSLSMSTPGGSLRDIFKEVTLTGCRIGETDYYKLHCIGEKGAIFDIYVDVNECMTRRSKGEFELAGTRIVYETKILKYGRFEGVMVPVESVSVVQDGPEETTRLVDFKLDVPILPSAFRPPVF